MIILQTQFCRLNKISFILNSTLCLTVIQIHNKKNLLKLKTHFS